MSKRILTVDDEVTILKFLRSNLEDNGYEVISASNGEEAVNFITNSPDFTFSLLISDVIMPRMGGRELSEWVLTLRPETKVLFMLGYTDNGIMLHEILDHKVEFIQKPFSPQDFLAKVRSVLDN